MSKTENTSKTQNKNKEREIALAYAAFNLENYHKEDSENLLKDLLSRGIEKIPALVLATLGSKLWMPKEMVTMKHFREKTIRHDYEPMINAYKQFQEKGYNPIKAALLAVGYVGQRASSLEIFEEEFNKKEKSLLKFLE